MSDLFDVLVIGGGINGCGCAADAASRGLSVLLCEQDDLASKTSSSSTKLIHGGLRYLEYFDFSLVKKSLTERETLLKLAPHLVRPLPICLPIKLKLRPNWIIRIGLFIYDHLNRKNTLPKTQFISRNQQSIWLKPLDKLISKAFIYYDCVTDDARLTITNALQAKEHGATVLTQTRLVKATVVDGLWQITLKNKAGQSFQVSGKSLINAAGPWVESVNELLNIPTQHGVSLIKGSHVVVNQLYEGEHAYLLQNDDKRVVFVVPYHGYSMIGTTEVPVNSQFDTVSIDDDEINYLFTLIDRYFNRQLQKTDIVNSWSGVRQLLSDDGKDNTALSREYTYDYSNHPAPCITLYGGKITTYRQLSEETIEQLRPVFPSMPESSTQTNLLPGALNIAEYKRQAQEKYQWLDQSILVRYLVTYGTCTELILSNCKKTEDLGIYFENGLYQVEVDYLVREEWAKNAEDILWRRTKLGLNFSEEQTNTLMKYLNSSIFIEQHPFL